MNKKDYMYIMSYIQNKKYSCEEITFRTICDIQSMIRDIFYKNDSDPDEFPTTHEVELMYTNYREVLKEYEEEYQ